MGASQGGFVPWCGSGTKPWVRPVRGVGASVWLGCDWGWLFFRDAEFFAQGADSDDQVLDGLHGACCYGVGGEVRGLRVVGEGDGLCRSGVVVEGMPDLFGEEGHEGAEKAQGGFE